MKRNANVTRILSVILCLLMMLSVVSVATTAFAAEYTAATSTPTSTLKSYNCDEIKDFHKYRVNISTVTFFNNTENRPIYMANREIIEEWDVSEAGDESVIAWIEVFYNNICTKETFNYDDLTDKNNRYNLYIAAKGNLKANPDSGKLFYNFTNLIGFDGLNYLDTSDVTNMNGMFSYCESLTKLDLSSFDTSKVNDMSYMFANCINLKTMNLDSFDTTNVVTMRNMFSNCHSIESLRLNSFNTNNVIDMTEMFYCCENLRTIYVSDSWTTVYVVFSNDMFYNNINNAGPAPFNESKTSDFYANGNYYLILESPRLDEINRRAEIIQFFFDIFAYFKNAINSLITSLGFFG